VPVATGGASAASPRRRCGRRHGLGQFGIAPRQHLAHRRVVVAAGDAFDVEAPVLALCIWCCSKTTQEACVASPAVWLMSKHSMRRRRVGDVQVQRLDQRARALLLRAFFGQQPRQRELGALGRHLQPDAALLARLVLRAHAHCRGFAQGLDQRRVDRRGWSPAAAARPGRCSAAR
jgi:hypothetical protein